MANFLDTLLEVLNADKRFFAEDGTLLRNKVYESALSMDAGLIALYGLGVLGKQGAGA